MGFRSVLVDLVVKVDRIPAGAKVAGETPMIDDLSTPFKGRLDEPTAQEIRSDQIQFIEYVRDVTMLMAIKDTLGVVVDLKADERVRVLTGPYAGEYEVKGKPTPIRKKRTQIGWEVALKEYSGRVA